MSLPGSLMRCWCLAAVLHSAIDHDRGGAQCSLSENECCSILQGQLSLDDTDPSTRYRLSIDDADYKSMLLIPPPDTDYKLMIQIMH